MRRTARVATGIIGTAMALGGAATAIAQPVVTITGNSGTQRITNYLPLQIGDSDIINPFGALPVHPASPIVTITGATVQITLSPALVASASNVGGGETTEVDGKLDFDVHFDGPVLLQAVFSEAGNYTTNTTGTVSVAAGVVITETDVPGGASDGGNFTTNLTNGSWGASLSTGGFETAYSDFHFSIDNRLVAEALGDPAAAATINKSSLVITINTAAGGGVPEPASLGILALGVGGVLLRRRASRTA